MNSINCPDCKVIDNLGQQVCNELIYTNHFFNNHPNEDLYYCEECKRYFWVGYRLTLHSGYNNEH